MNNSKNCWTVYRHITPDGKIYVGCTCRKPERRWSNGNHYRKNTPFGKAIEEWGWENIKHEILDTDLDEFTAKCLEEYYIFSYRTYVGFSDCNGYNCTLGGDGKFGFNTSKETRIKQSEVKKGKHNSKEHNRKISESKKGEKNPMYGKHHSESTKRKQSEAMKGRPGPNIGKHWKLIDGKRFYYE